MPSLSHQTIEPATNINRWECVFLIFCYSFISDQKDSIGRAKIGHGQNNPASSVPAICVNSRFFQNLKTDIPGKLPEILNSDNPYVGCIVPLEGQLFGNGCITCQHQLKSNTPVTEIGETDDSHPADP